jgi:membrane-bound lytic murein transglycosylase A
VLAKRNTAGVQAIAGLAIVLFFLAACAKAPDGPPQLDLRPVDAGSVPGWDVGTFADALPAFLKSCTRLTRLPATRSLSDDPRFGAAGDWHAACAEANAVANDPGFGPDTARRFFERTFTVYRASDRDADEGLITGYFEAMLNGSFTRSETNNVPLYRPPPDMVRIPLAAFNPEWEGKTLTGIVDGRTIVPAPTRSEIEAGALAERDLELLWVDDPIDAFFLHIQGSGRVDLAEGGAVRVGYAGKNGHPYFAIGRELIQRGDLTRETVSMQSIRAWLTANPDEADAVMNLNKSFVFFHVLKEDGPIGSQGVVLTPERSVAVDRAFIPMGVPVWLDTRHPLDREAPLRRLAVAQDTGGAIKGPLRVDLFWGGSRAAAAAAGEMKEPGALYLFLPRTISTS